eukprot:scaffold87016_cov54-Cyclotella_meneghiniana.AAC.6
MQIQAFDQTTKESTVTVNKLLSLSNLIKMSSTFKKYDNQQLEHPNLKIHSFPPKRFCVLGSVHPYHSSWANKTPMSHYGIFSLSPQIFTFDFKCVALD